MQIAAGFGIASTAVDTYNHAVNGDWNQVLFTAGTFLAALPLLGLSGCFVKGTLITLSSLPARSASIDGVWSAPNWLDASLHEISRLSPERPGSVATRTDLQVPIESLPIGSRVPTKNPNRWEVDPQPEPDQATWAKLSITVERSDGGIVDAELIRPRSWILANGICTGRMLPLNLPELEVSGLALVTGIDDCPPIADGEGSVVTARFVTREVHVVASVEILGPDGTVETITGTPIHPMWSVDRQAWVPMGELAEGETLQGLDGLAIVLSVTLSRVTQPVYNIEVLGEHVYQVGELGVLVHNACAPKAPKFTEPTLPNRTIVNEGGVRIEHYTRGNDHPPSHAHVYGQGKPTRIGANGKPLKGDPKLSPQQQTVVDNNLTTIRSALNKIKNWWKWKNHLQGQ